MACLGELAVREGGVYDGALARRGLFPDPEGRLMLEMRVAPLVKAIPQGHDGVELDADPEMHVEADRAPFLTCPVA